MNTGQAPDPIAAVVGLSISIVDGDFAFSGNGGLAMVSGAEALGQRLAQRLRDAQNSYLFEVGWGAGLGSRVQSPLGPQELGSIRALCIQQAALDPVVQRVARVDLRYDGVRLEVLVVVQVGGVLTTLPLTLQPLGVSRGAG